MEMVPIDYIKSLVSFINRLWSRGPFSYKALLEKKEEAESRKLHMILGFVVKSAMENLQKEKGELSMNSIPVDLLMEIFARVPSKSIGRLRCVSKFCGSILGRSDFTELFLTKSLTRPRLLFVIKRGIIFEEELFFYSSPQPQNLDGTSSCVVATRHNIRYEHDPLDACTPLSGFLMFQEFWKAKVRVICNPVTGESRTLPSVKGKFAKIFFGYDPINKQFKVLYLTSPSPDSERPSSHRILTLNPGKRKWRRIECRPHSPLHRRTETMCINGVLYYLAKVEESFMIVCFGVRSEEFGFINLDANMLPGSQWKLVDYKGQLGAQMMFRWHRRYDFIGSEEFVLWVLEDGGNHQWSKHTYRFPPKCNELGEFMKVIGMATTGEILFTPVFLSDPFYVFFYNLERGTFTRVRIQGLEESEGVHRTVVDTFLDYTENLQALLRF